MQILKSAVTLLLLTPIFTAAQTTNPSASVEVIAPIFHQLVAFHLPTTFSIAAPDHATEDFYLHEIPLHDETVERWTQLLTVSGFRGLTLKGATAQRAVESIAGHFQQSCPATFASARIGAMRLSGRPAYVLIASCGSVADTGGQPTAMHSETALLAGIEGDQDIYTLQWAERDKASTTPIPIDQAKWQARLSTLSPIHVCARIQGEKAPYPSCTGKSFKVSSPTGN